MTVLEFLVVVASSWFYCKTAVKLANQTLLVYCYYSSAIA